MLWTPGNCTSGDGREFLEPAQPGKSRLKQLFLPSHVAMGGPVCHANLDVWVAGCFQVAPGCAECEERGAACVRRVHGHAIAIVPFEAVAVGAFVPR